MDCASSQFDWPMSAVKTADRDVQPVKPKYRPGSQNPLFAGYSRPANQFAGSIVDKTFPGPNHGQSWNWNNRNIVAPSGRYLAFLEQTRIAVAPAGGKASLFLALAAIRASFERARQLAEVQALAHQRRQTPPAAGWSLNQASPADTDLVSVKSASICLNLGLPLPTLGDAPQPAVDQWNLRFFFYQPHSLLATLTAERYKRTTRHFLEHLHLTRRLVHRIARPFCGRSWSRRLWHLLHGSHPPKSEGPACCLAFGGA